jgi:dTDP-4-dehydrorhamnose reductase
MKTILVLGGTQMLGRDLVETLRDSPDYTITLANRGITNANIFSELKHLKIDRNSKEACLNLSNNTYDFAIDFSCYTADQFKITSQLINCSNYIYISTISVFDALDNNYANSDTAHGRYLNYCIDKKNIETYILSTDFTHKTFIVRPCAVYGANDYTQRFEQRDNQYFWKNTNIKADEETNCIHVSVVTQKIIEILENQTPENTRKEIINIGKIPNAIISNQ